MGPLLPADTQRFLTAFYEVAGDPDPATVMRCFIVRASLLRARGEFQETHPLIVGPVFTDIPFEAGTDLDIVAETMPGMRLTLAVNALGLPAVAVPVGVVQGLPQVVQIIGPRYREGLCLDAAAALRDRFGNVSVKTLVGGPPAALRVVAIALLVPGVAILAWSVSCS